MALYLALSIAGAAGTHTLMAAINNLFYFGVTQTLPGLLAILFLRRVRPAVIVAGLLAGDALAILLYVAEVPIGGINAGFLGLLLNGAIVAVATRLSPGQAKRSVAEEAGALPLTPPKARH